MPIPAAPTVPVPTSPTFATDAYAFTLWQAGLGPAIDAETTRLNAVGYGSYNASSTTSLTIGTGSKSLTIETGKGYVAGQAVLIASTAGPPNFMTGQVTSYTSGTGALVVNVTATGGSGTVAAWTISVTALSAGGGVSPDSIVVLTSGTSWTCPAGVTKAKIRVQGAGGSGGTGSASNQVGSPGGSGGYSEILASVTPGVTYTYSIGSPGAAVSGTAIPGNAGGTTTITIGLYTVTCTGGSGGTTSSSVAPGGSASGGDLNINGVDGQFYGIGAWRSLINQGVLGGYGSGGYGCVGGQASKVGGASVIILELYK